MLRKPKTKDRPEYYALSNKELILLSKGGDERAKRALADRKTVRRMITYDDQRETSLSFELSNGLTLDFKREGYGHVRMFIEIKDRTAVDDIKKGWREIHTWRDLLQEWQGPWTYSGDDNFYRRLHDRQIRGESYADLAESLNRKVEKDLREYVNDCRIWNKVQPALKTEQDIRVWESVGVELGFEGGYGLIEAKQPLWIMGLKEKEIDDFCQETIESLEQGEAPFWTVGPRPYEEPITRDHVITRLRIWRQKNEKWLKVRGKADKKWMRNFRDRMEGVKTRTAWDRYFERTRKRTKEAREKMSEMVRTLGTRVIALGIKSDKDQEKLAEHAMKWQEYCQKVERLEELVRKA